LNLIFLRVNGWCNSRILQLENILGDKANQFLAGTQAERFAKYKSEYLIEEEKKLFQDILKANYSLVVVKKLLEELAPLVDIMTGIEQEMKKLAESHKKQDREQFKTLQVRYATAKENVEKKETQIETMEQVTQSAKAKAEEKVIYINYIADNF
jgi:pyruvate-formate lyase-activating enzyme